MKFTALKLATVAALAFSPVAANADAIAASLSASFGNGFSQVGGGIGNGGAGGAIRGANSIAVAAAAGDTAVASATANRDVSTAAAGASESQFYVPRIETRLGRHGKFSTDVYFDDSQVIDQIADLQEQINGINDTLAAICSEEGHTGSTVTVPEQNVRNFSLIFGWYTNYSQLVPAIVDIQGSNVVINCGLVS